MELIVIILYEDMGNRQVVPKIDKEEVDKIINDGKIIFYISEKIIDATKYVDKHPGGVECLKKKVGKDCKEDYEFHSISGKKLWDKMVIGNLKRK